MRKPALKAAREKLVEMRRQVLREISNDLRQGREGSKEEGMDTYDLASEERDREISFILTDREREKVQAIQEALDRLMAGRTTFVIAHRLATVRRADLILVMDAGRIVQRGRHADLLAQGGLYRQIHDLQLSLPGSDLNAEQEETLPVRSIIKTPPSDQTLLGSAEERES